MNITINVTTSKAPNIKATPGTPHMHALLQFVRYILLISGESPFCIIENDCQQPRKHTRAGET